MKHCINTTKAYSNGFNMGFVVLSRIRILVIFSKKSPGFTQNPEIHRENQEDFFKIDFEKLIRCSDVY